VHHRTLSIEQARGTPVPKASRIRKPDHVSYSVESLENPRAYWVQIDGREDENFVGRLDVQTRGKDVRVTTSNVNAYTLFLAEGPIDSNTPVRVIENGHGIEDVGGEIFRRRPASRADAVLVKTRRTHGPIWDVFTDPYVVIWDDAPDERLRKVKEELAVALAGDGPCHRASAVPEGLLSTRNLVLVGDPNRESWPCDIPKALPAEVSSGWISILGKRFKGHHLGLAMVYPHPQDATRYVALFAGTSPKAIAHMPLAYETLKQTRPVDVAVFEVEEDGELSWRVFEKFDTTWNWHRHWDQVLMEVSRRHPRWQWNQWAARVARVQLNADVAICEESLQFDEAVLTDQITYRDVANAFRNHWMVKVEVDGRELRGFLTGLFGRAADPQVAKPIVDGIALFGGGSGGRRGSLTINDLQEDKKYTLVCNYKCLNGRRISDALMEYAVVADAFLVPALRSYLMCRGAIDIDEELSGLVPTLF